MPTGLLRAGWEGAIALIVNAAQFVFAFASAAMSAARSLLLQFFLRCLSAVNARLK
jgi:hypothetical protein